MSNFYISRLLLAAACAVLTACGGGDGAVSDSAAANSISTLVSSTMAGGGASIGGNTPEAQSSITWTECATENDTCNFRGETEVRYGTATNFVTKSLTGPVACSNTVFGDPSVGQVKSCSIASTKVWTECATEGAVCLFSGSKQVRYGTESTYVAQTLTGPVSCTNTTFGDPAPNIVKSCKIADMVIAPTWNECAAEGGSCSVSSTVEVRYGVGAQYSTKTVNGPFKCDNATFGDPAPNQVKSCKILGTVEPSLATPQLSPPTSADLPSAVPAFGSIPGAITTVQLISSSSATQVSAAATFGQSFTQGDMPKGSSLSGKLSNGSMVPVQMDAKAYHADGSLRHAVITVQLPSMAAKEAQTVGLMRDNATLPTTQVKPAELLASGFTASFNATIAGVRYSASADELLKSGKYTTWLAGGLATEWMVAAPLKTASGSEHPHLHARFAIRFYPVSNSARVDVTVENGWAHVAMPSNFTYDAQVLVGGQQVFAKAALNHYSHARWRKLFWWGNAPKVDVRHNIAYLIASKAVPNYDQSLVIRESTIANWSKNWTSGNNGPMETGVGVPYMPTTGARADIGPMPTWSALYLLSMDARMKNLTLGMSEVAGSWSAHYRNKVTDRPVTLADFPYMSLLSSGAHTLNPATGKFEEFPDCPETRCATPMTIDTSHQPAFSYLPYLVTGDYFHLEELQFWANASSFYSHAAERYRDGGKGLVKADQIRGQAWSLRTFAEAAYITPDNDPQKANFVSIVNSNIDWYNETFPNNPTANKLGVLDHYGHVGYLDGLGIGPWQDDFFTTSVGRMVELGFSKAEPLLAWKSKFVVDRMVGPGFCWTQASLYTMKVRDTTSSPLYKSIAEVYQANNKTAIAQLSCASTELATSLGLRVGEMVGDFTPSGTQAIMQPALAYSAGLNGNAKKAWAQFAARPYKPDFANEPQYAIVPR